MKEKIVSTVTPYLLDGSMIISFDPKWIQVFNGIPTFNVIIDKDGKLCLIGPRILKRGEN